MSLSSAATIANSGLRAVAMETSVVARNITGATATEQYSRRISQIVPTIGGVTAGTVTRATNQAVFGNLLSSTASAAAQASILSGLDTLNQVNGDLSATSQSPAALLTQFTSALQAYAASPSDETLAAEAVATANTLASGLNTAADAVQNARADADQQIASSVKTINSLLDQFQTLNLQVVKGTAAGSDVSDAQDSRDAVLTKLAEEIGITTMTAANGDVAIYTDSGVPLFQGGKVRDISFAPTQTYTPTTVGQQVVANGISITGDASPMPILSGRLAGLVTLRDDLAVTYQAQLDNIAAGLIDAFHESDQVGSGPDLPGLFTTPGATSMPTVLSGLASNIVVNPTVDPAKGGDLALLRDGGISNPGNPSYLYNTGGDESYFGRISELVDSLSASQTFAPAGAITTSASLSDYAAASVSWLEGERSRVTDQQNYQNTLLDTATKALSNSTGVNLDEEMSKMLELEHSYAASAKLIAAIDSMYADLLNSI
jgi:flagellar hook-associated protein 1 FlgK